VLADAHGNVVVVSTRDCSLQRRYQKVVEEAPAPFLTQEQTAQLYSASKDIVREAEYVGAGTCEFLVGQDGLISFLEVNTRLQVEHPVTEEVSGIDLVREQFRIAEGLPLSFSDPEPRGHSFEFRINGEDAGRGFLPAPGTVTAFVAPSGPGVRVDAGVEAGSVVGGAFDSLLAKLIVTGATRQEALERSRRALDEMQVEGLATLLPFHRKVVRDEAFTSEPFRVHNRWIETEFDNDLPPHAGSAEAEEPEPRERVVVEVGGRRLEVVLPASLGASTGAAAQKGPAKRSARKAGAAAAGNSLTSPMQGTLVKVAVEDGATVAAGDLVVVLEAMKMEQPINAHRAGTVRNLSVQVGETVTSGAVLCEIED
jgi:acetyl-CoA/propionyl-CoA carboxylase biotin carboxyl carrier protein